MNNPTVPLPGMTLKAWAFVKSDGTLLRSYGVASASRGAVGQYTVTCSTAFAAAAAVGVANASPTASGPITANVGYSSATAMAVRVQVSAADADAHFYIAIYE